MNNAISCRRCAIPDPYGDGGFCAGHAAARAQPALCGPVPADTARARHCTRHHPGCVQAAQSLGQGKPILADLDSNSDARWHVLIGRRHSKPTWYDTQLCVTAIGALPDDDLQGVAVLVLPARGGTPPDAPLPARPYRLPCARLQYGRQLHQHALLLLRALLLHLDRQVRPCAARKRGW